MRQSIGYLGKEDYQSMKSESANKQEEPRSQKPCPKQLDKKVRALGRGNRKSLLRSGWAGTKVDRKEMEKFPGRRAKEMSAQKLLEQSETVKCGEQENVKHRDK